MFKDTNKVMKIFRMTDLPSNVSDHYPVVLKQISTLRRFIIRFCTSRQIPRKQFGVKLIKLSMPVVLTLVFLIFGKKLTVKT